MVSGENRRDQKAGEPFMDQEHMETHLEEIRHLLSQLHGEVTDLEESYSQVLQVLRKIEGAANIDDLTGLLRRRSFFQKWEALLDGCQRMNEASGVLMIDIDHFKRVNDTHGHATGDEVIRNVATLLKQFESPSCIVGRIGGEEFAVVVKGSSSEISGVAELIRKKTERLHGDNEKLKCTLSIGVAIDYRSSLSPFNSGNSDSLSDSPCLRSRDYATQLLNSADLALYEAKSSGRNQVRIAKKATGLKSVKTKGVAA
jgi:diguanylate cyclase (GGDEF)-like protein